MKKCPNCHHIYEDSQSFCLEDGAALMDSSETQATAVLPRRRKSKFLPVLIGLFGLIGASAIGWFLLASKKPTANQNDSRMAENVSIQTPAPSPIPAAIPNQASVPSSPTASPEAVNINVSINSEAKPETASNSKMSDEGNSAKQTAPQTKIEDHLISFELKHCRKSGALVTCDFSLTNKGPDRRLRLVAYQSNLYDELGNGYNGKNGQLANQQGGAPRIDFISGVTTRAQVMFEGIEPNMTKITLLRIQYDTGDDYGLEVKFRNPPLLISK